MTDGKPTIVKMATTYTPRYLSREGNCNGSFGRFCFGEKLNRVLGKRLSAVDGERQSLTVEYKMGEKEYRCFRKAKLFFDKERQRLYKIVAEQIFPLESLARDRMAAINGIIEDCKRGYRLSLVRTVAADDRIVYEGSDNTIKVTLEMRKQADGHKRLVFVIVNKKMQNGEESPSNSEDVADNVEVQI